MLDRLNVFVHHSERPPDTEMQALRNIGVTKHASDLAQSGVDLTADTLCEMHATLMGDDPIAGQLRDRQNRVGGAALGGPITARHVGPPAEFVPELPSKPCTGDGAHPCGRSRLRVESVMLRRLRAAS